MKILFIFPEAPFPKNWGPRNYGYNILQAASLFADVDVVGFYFDDEGFSRWQSFADSCSFCRDIKYFKINRKNNKFKWLFFNLKTVLEYDQEEVSCIANKFLGKKYDIVHIDRFIISFLGKNITCKKLISPHDCYSLNSFRSFLCSSVIFKFIYIYRFFSYLKLERINYKYFDLIMAVSHVDADYLRRINKKNVVETIGIPVGDDFLMAKWKGLENKKIRIIVCGAAYIDPIANCIYEFLYNFSEKLYQKFDDIEIIVWSKQITSNLDKLIKVNKKISILKWVDNYIETLQESSVYVYPQRCSSGIQTKVQEAMAIGVPVVAMKNVMDPLKVKHKVNGYICTSYEEMFEGILEILNDKDFAKKISSNSKDHMKNNFSIYNVSKKFQIYCDQVLNKY
jgi:glycosyltransferase involved in cell wall biosynthesis